jgi:hypothetical protein
LSSSSQSSSHDADFDGLIAEATELELTLYGPRLFEGQVAAAGVEDDEETGA